MNSAEVDNLPRASTSHYAHSSRPSSELSSSQSKSDALAQSVARHLGHQSEVIRSQAARALAQVGNSSVADSLQTLLMDEDPDVRVDAMQALVRCARAEDAGIVRASLIGDPEFEVKKAALSVLEKLADSGSVNLLCALASSRCDESISWDESAHGWDEWLDLQPSVVRALTTISAAIGDYSCIDTLLSIREDEFALDLDGLVFKALLQLGGTGVKRALEFLDHSDTAVRTQAVRVFSNASPELLAGHLEKLLSASDARLRILAVSSGVCEPADLRDRMLNDIDVSVRLAAIVQIARRYEPAQRALSASGVSSAPIVDRDDAQYLLEALNDTDERVRLSALSLSISLGIVVGVQNDSVINQIVENEKFPLLQFPVSLFSSIVGDRSTDILSLWLADENAAAERRIYAAKALSFSLSGDAYEALSAGLIDKVSQVRVACLEGLVSWTKLTIQNDACESEGLDTALRAATIDSLSMAISGEVFATSALNQNDRADTPIDQPITWHERPGSGDDTATAPLSTLEAIELANQPSVESRAENIDDTSIRDTSIQHNKDTSIDEIKRNKGARRRVSVSGPEHYEEDLRCLALMMCSQVSDSSIERATLSAMEEPSAKIVETALRSLHERYLALADEDTQLPGDLVGDLMDLMQSDNPSIRYWSAAVLLSSNGDDSCVSSTVVVPQLMDDKDALCRSLAMQYAADKEQLCTGLSDSNSTVRNAAVDRVLQGNSALDVNSLIDILVENRAIDTLRRVMNGNEQAMPLMSKRLDSPELSADTLNVLLGSMTAS